MNGRLKGGALRCSLSDEETISLSPWFASVNDEVLCIALDELDFSSNSAAYNVDPHHCKRYGLFPFGTQSLGLRLLDRESLGVAHETLDLLGYNCHIESLTIRPSLDMTGKKKMFPSRSAFGGWP